MKTKLIKVVIRNYFPHGTYENNIVEFKIPEEAADIIDKYWREDVSLRDSNVVCSRYLCRNQDASVGIYKDEKDVDGVVGVFSVPDVDLRNKSVEFVEATSKNSLSGKYIQRYKVTESGTYWGDESYFDTLESAKDYMEECLEDVLQDYYEGDYTIDIHTDTKCAVKGVANGIDLSYRVKIEKV